MKTARSGRPLVVAVALVGLALIGCQKSQPPATEPGPGVAPAPVDTARAQSVNNLKQVMLAWHSFHELAGVLPHDGWTHPKRPALSWRVAILPHIEQDELYKQFKLDEPWDSEHNKKLIPKMPKTYASGGLDPADGKTRYRGFVGPAAALPPLPKAGGKMVGRKRDEKTNRDGHTIGVVETEDAVTWTKPDDVPFPGPLPKLHQWADGRVLVAFLDGSVKIGDSALLTDDLFRWHIDRTDNSVITAPRGLWADPPAPPPLSPAEQKARDEEEARYAAIDAKHRELRAEFDKWFDGHQRTGDDLARRRVELEDQLARAQAVGVEKRVELEAKLAGLTASRDTLTRDSADATKALAAAESDVKLAKADLTRTEAMVADAVQLAADRSEVVVAEQRDLARLAKAHDAATDEAERRKLADQIAKQRKTLDDAVVRAKSADEVVVELRKRSVAAAKTAARSQAVADEQSQLVARANAARQVAEQELADVRKTLSRLDSLAPDQDKPTKELEAVRNMLSAHEAELKAKEDELLRRTDELWRKK